MSDNLLYRKLMIRKYDYLEQKQDEEPYNFVQDSFDLSQEFESIPRYGPNRLRSMHATICDEDLPQFNRNTRRQSRERGYSKYLRRQEKKQDEYATRKSNFIYHKTLDKFKDQLYSMRIKEGVNQISHYVKIPSLVPSLSSNKKISSYTDKCVQGMQKKLKNRLQLVEKLKAASNAKKAAIRRRGLLTEQSTRQTLDRRIGDINKIVCEDAGSINLKIQEMDPINQMHRIRTIVQKGHRELRLVSDEEHTNIEENIYEVRQLMRKYLREKHE